MELGEGLRMKYLEYLEAKREIKQSEIERLLEKYKTEPVGSGYIDIITPSEYIEYLIEGFTKMNIAVECVTWWCHCSDSNKKQYCCPHGMGGPKSKYYDGWYSEMGFEFETFDIPTEEFQELNYDNELPNKIKTINDTIKSYVTDLSKARGYSECLTPAFWLHVPDEWKRIRYINN